MPLTAPMLALAVLGLTVLGVALLARLVLAVLRMVRLRRRLRGGGRRDRERERGNDDLHGSVS